MIIAINTKGLQNSHRQRWGLRMQVLIGYDIKTINIADAKLRFDHLSKALR